jgi:hypothetical protein
MIQQGDSPIYFAQFPYIIYRNNLSLSEFVQFNIMIELYVKCV